MSARRIPIIELAICCIAVVVQLVGGIAVRRLFLHREFIHDVPRWLEVIGSSWCCWGTFVVTAALIAVLAIARPPHWVWSVLATVSCIAAIGMYVVGYQLT